MSTARESFDGLLSRAAGKTATPADAEETSERFFGHVTGIQDRAHNLEFRKAEGGWAFLEYSYLVGGDWLHAGEFLLRFATGERVTVRGRNLRALYEKVLRHRVTWLREADRDEKGAERDLFIDEIEGPVKDEEGEGAAAR